MALGNSHEYYPQEAAFSEWQSSWQPQMEVFKTLKRADSIRNQRVRSVHAPQWLAEVNSRYESSYTLATLPDDLLDELTLEGSIHGLYVIGVYEPSQEARVDSLKYLSHYQQVLEDPHLSEESIVSSCFALVSDNLNPIIARDYNELGKFAKRLEQKGIEFIVDFIPNHVALDHPWRDIHPEYLLEVDQETYEYKKENYYPYKDAYGVMHYYARGKHYTGEGLEEVWTDTLQLDYRNRQLRQVMVDQLVKLVDYVGAVRVDTAPLPQYEIFRHTWGDVVSFDKVEAWDFWREATNAIGERTQELQKQFRLIGESYDNPHVLEDFDVVYGSYLYGVLVNVAQGRADANYVKHELYQVYQDLADGKPKKIFFLSNHDLNTTVHTFHDMQRTLAALSVVSWAPGDWLIHQGEEQLRFNPPMQVIKPYVESRIPHVVETMASQYEWALYFNNSEVFQNGLPRYIETSTPIIAQSYEYEGTGLIQCTNLSDYDTIACVPIPEWVSKEDIHVFDLDTLRFIDQEIISDPQEFGNQMCMVLGPWKRQIILYSKK
jgi:hypothetical protein